MRTLDGRYELWEAIGRGSTGTVFAARDLETSRTVAVKVLEAHVVAPRRARKRFLREVETAGALRHPHVVEVLGHGETPDGGAFLVMERLLGKTLAARLRETGPLPQPRAIRIMAQVLDAVLAAHRFGVVHRDLKPSNVMLVERDGDPDFVKVCDFGLVKDIERDSYDPVRDGALAVDLGSITTEHGHICGTPEYMAPEQARGENVDERADLYAVAAMLFQAVVGRPPFSARSPLAVVSLHLTAPPPRPSELRPDLGIFPALESLILRGLAKDRAERPSSAEVFRKDLLRIERDYAGWVGRQTLRASSSMPVESATLSLEPKPARPSSRAMAAVAVSLGVAVFGTAAWTARKPHGASTALAAPSLPRYRPAPTSSPIVAATGPLRREPISFATVSVETTPAPIAKPPAKKAKPKSPAPSSLLAAANEALAEGRVADACAAGEKASEIQQASPAVFKFLGGCFMRLGNRDKGRAYYRRYLELVPEGPDAVFVREMVK